MSESDLSVKDTLAVVTASIDQAQALIDEARLKFQNDQLSQLDLDRRQFELDLQRERVKVMRVIDDILESL